MPVDPWACVPGPGSTQSIYKYKVLLEVVEGLQSTVQCSLSGGLKMPEIYSLVFVMSCKFARHPLRMLSIVPFVMCKNGNASECFIKSHSQRAKLFSRNVVYVQIGEGGFIFICFLQQTGFSVFVFLPLSFSLPLHFSACQECLSLTHTCFLLLYLHTHTFKVSLCRNVQYFFGLCVSVDAEMLRHSKVKIALFRTSLTISSG